MKSGGSQDQASKGPLPVGSHRMCLIPPALSCDNVNQGSLLERLCQGCGKKQVFSGNIFCIPSLGTLSCYYQLMMIGTFLKPTVPDASLRLTWEAGPSKDSGQDCCVNSFLPTAYQVLHSLAPASISQLLSPCCQSLLTTSSHSPV